MNLQGVTQQKGLPAPELTRSTHIPGLVNCHITNWKDPPFLMGIYPLFRLGYFQEQTVCLPGWVSWIPNPNWRKLLFGLRYQLRMRYESTIIGCELAKMGYIEILTKYKSTAQHVCVLRVTWGPLQTPQNSSYPLVMSK